MQLRIVAHDARCNQPANNQSVPSVHILRSNCLATIQLVTQAR